MDALFLSRIQFGMTASFHFLFPPISIGLSWLLVVLEGLALKKNDRKYQETALFFSRLLGINFAAGVTTGLVMIFQFGTNWSRYSEFVGNVFGAPLASEALFAFFLESTFIGLYLFGRNRIPKWLTWLSIFIVACATLISSFCILVANSWMQTPDGYVVQDGKAVMVDFWAAVFNPSTLIRFFHTIDAALICGAFFVAGFSAYIVRKHSSHKGFQAALSLALIFGLAVSILEIFPFGHLSARQVAQTQPAKSASMEGLYHSTTGAPLVIFAIPGKMPNPKLTDAIVIPKFLSWLAFGNFNAEVKGVDAFKKSDLPPLRIVFITFHLMVALGIVFVLTTFLGCFLWWRNKLYVKRWFLKWLMIAIPLPVIACNLGWLSAEIGRQPWAVYNELRTADAVSPVINANHVLFSIILFGTIYLFLTTTYIYLLVQQSKNMSKNIAAGGSNAI